MAQPPGIAFLFVRKNYMICTIFEDSNYIILDKPSGLFVHRSKLDYSIQDNLLVRVREALGQRVFPIHRLDRKTSGVIIMAKNLNCLKKLSADFEQNEVKKMYLAIVRGHAPLQGVIDYPLINEKQKPQEAITYFHALQYIEAPFSSSTRYTTSRYTLLSLYPVTGRMHQIRKHLAHVRYPIIGDRPYGCNKQNRYFTETYGLDTHLLHAWGISFVSPEGSNQTKQYHTPPSLTFTRMAHTLGLTIPSVDEGWKHMPQHK